MSDSGKVSDGYHTFDELYEHRHALFLALCRLACADFPDDIWRSRLHADGTMYPGWFVLGIGRRAGEQITYHLPDRLWDDAAFANTEERAPEWDGHTQIEVLSRIGKL